MLCQCQLCCLFFKKIREISEIGVKGWFISREAREDHFAADPDTDPSAALCPRAVSLYWRIMSGH